jgi:hypothetical protein
MLDYVCSFQPKSLFFNGEGDDDIRCTQSIPFSMMCLDQLDILPKAGASQTSFYSSNLPRKVGGSEPQSRVVDGADRRSI